MSELLSKIEAIVMTLFVVQSQSTLEHCTYYASPYIGLLMAIISYLTIPKDYFFGFPPKGQTIGAMVVRQDSRKKF